MKDCLFLHVSSVCLQVLRSGYCRGRLCVQHQPDRHHPSGGEPDQPDRSEPKRHGAVRRRRELRPSVGPEEVDGE